MAAPVARGGPDCRKALTRDVPPPIGRSDAEVLAFVRANPGAIGYVSATADIQGARVLALR
jgi:hypothetical protein